MPIARPFNPGGGRFGARPFEGGAVGPFGGQMGRPDNPMGRPLGNFDKLKGKKKIKKSGNYKLKKGETVVGKKKKSDTHAYIAGRKA